MQTIERYVVMAAAFITLSLQAASCTYEGTLPEGAQLTCTQNSDCPPGTVCRETVGLCVAADSTDTIPPEFISGPTVSPNVGREGASFAMTFTVSEALARDPIVMLGSASAQKAFTVDELTTDRANQRYSFSYTALGDEAEETVSTTVSLVDRVGNSIERAGGSLTFDFTPPTVSNLRWEGNAATSTHMVAFLGTTTSDALLVGASLVSSEGLALADLLSETTLTPSATPGVLEITGVIDLSTIVLNEVSGVAIQLQIEDLARNAAAAESARTGILSIDDEAPSGASIVIQEKPLTANTSATLAISVTGATQMFVDGDVVDDDNTLAWVPVVGSLVVTLTSNDGIKTVRARFRDDAGNESVQVSDSTELATGAVRSDPELTLPVGQGAVKNGDVLIIGGTGEPLATVTSARLVNISNGATLQTLTGVAIDAQGQLSGVVITSGLPDGVNIALEVILQSRSLNSIPADSRSAAVATDLTAPTGLSASLTQGSVVNTTPVTLQVAAVGAAQFFIDGDVADDADVRAWIPFATTQAVTLVAGDGNKGLTIRVRDLAFNEAQRTIVVKLDTVPPTVTPVLLPPGGQSAVKSGDTMSFGGAAEPGSTLVSAHTIDENGTMVANVTSAMTLDPSTGAISGSATLGFVTATTIRLEVVVSDGANTNTPQNGRSAPIEVTSTPASTPAFSMPAGQTALKDGDTVGVAGTASAGATIVHAWLINNDDGTQLQDIASFVTLSAGGTFSGSFTLAPLAHGTNVALEIVVDRFGLLSAASLSRSTARVIDNQVPTGASVSVTAGAYVNSTSVALSTSASGATQMYIEGDVVAQAGTYAWITYANSANVTLQSGDGSKSITVRYRDDAFNTVQSSTSLTLDTTTSDSAPSIAGQFAVGRVKDNDTISISGNAEAGSTIQSWRLVFWTTTGGGTEAQISCLGDWIGSPTLSGAGVYGGSVTIGTGCDDAQGVSLEIIARNLAGTLSVAANSRSSILTLDNTPPAPASASVIRVGDEQPGFVARTSIGLSVDASEPDSGQVEIQVSGDVLNGTVWVPIPDTSSGAYTHNVSLVGGDGPKTLSVRFRDVVRNVTTAVNINIQLDSAGPPAPNAALLRLVETSPNSTAPALIDSSNNAWTLATTGGAMPVATRMVVYDDAGLSNRLVMIDSSGATEITGLVASALPASVALPLNGEEYYVVSLDDAGNESPPTRVFVPRFAFVTVPTQPRRAGVAFNIVFTSDIALAANPAVAVSTRTATFVSATSAPAPITYTYSFTPNGTEAEGYQDAVVRVTGYGPALAANSNGTDATTMTLDFTPPNIAPLLATLVQNDPGSADTISGQVGCVRDFTGADEITALFQTRVEIMQADGVTPFALPTMYAGTNGNFASVSVGDNLHANVFIRATDAAGNVALDTTSAGEIANDITAPLIAALTVTPAVQRHGQNVTITFSVTDNAHNLRSLPSVRATSDATPRYATHASGTVTTSDLSAHAFSYTFAVDSAQDVEQEHTVEVRTLDTQGNERVSQVALVLDYTPPTVANIVPGPASTWNGQGGFSGTVDDNLAGVARVEVSVRATGSGGWWNGVGAFSGSQQWFTASLAGGAWSYAAASPFLQSGSQYELHYRAVDVPGNTNSSAPVRTFVVDNSAPQTTITSNPPATTTTSLAAFDFTCTVTEPSCTFLCRMDGGSFSDCSGGAHEGTATYDLVAGVHTFEVYAVDEAGNADATPASYTWTIERQWDFISAGEKSTCGLVQNGGLYCWGNGTGSPTAVNHGEQWVLVAVSRGFTSAGHICAIRDNGGLWCWGANSRGQLGIGTRTPQTLPTQVGSATDWVDVATGDDHTCGIREDSGTGARSLYCWGKNSNLQIGQSYGGVNDSNFDRISPTAVTYNVPADTSWSQLSAGEVFTCAVTATPLSGSGAPAGSLWCWGKNEDGRLARGVGASGSNYAPGQVDAATDWAEVALGEKHGCAIKTGGALHCWGSNYTGEVGCGTTTATCGASVNPVGFPRPVSGGGTWLKVAPGSTSLLSMAVGSTSRTGSRTCAVKSDKTLWCWGENLRGLADPDSNTAIRGGGANLYVPTQVGSGVTWSGVAVGAGQFALNEAKEAYAWGVNYVGQLGLHTVGIQSTPISATPTDGGTTWSSVAGGGNHACGIRNNGTAACWGRGDLGMLGSGVVESSNAPIDVSGGYNDWTQLDAGSAFTMGLRSGAADTIYCWGDSTICKQAPFGIKLLPTGLTVSGVTNWTHITAGSDHACALTSDARLFCWGYNGFGQLGNGNTNQQTTPVHISPANTWQAVSAASSHTCAIRSDGTLWCWGSAGSGRLGYGGTTNQSSPIQESSAATDWVEVVTTDSSTCARRSDDSLYCWGYGGDGRLGNGVASQNDPTQVTGLWTQVFGGGSQVCAIDQLADAYCWGRTVATPTLFAGPSSANRFAFSKGMDSTFILLSTGERWVWGANVLGQLGNGDGIRFTPTKLVE